MMKANPEELKGLVLTGGIAVKNSSTYRRRTISKPVMKGGKKILQFGTIERNRAKVGRNAPCPCGSGKKVKNCCPKLAT
jgi:uncharacterized protein YchJ